MLENGDKFSLLKPLNQHVVYGRSTLKDCIVNENTFRNAHGLSINRKYGQMVTIAERLFVILFIIIIIFFNFFKEKIYEL